MGLLSKLFGLPGEAKHAAAMNALVAKYLLNHMSEHQSQAVYEKIHTLLFREGQITQEEAAWLLEGNERVFFGFAALALMEMGIAPPGDIWRWVRIRNPFGALLDADREIEIARLGLERQRGIKVSLAGHTQPNWKA
jgi:hypothetical protein